MLKPKFCYRVLSDAGLAHDGEGNDTECFIHADYQGGHLLDAETYDKHHEEVRLKLAGQLEINEKHLQCISQEEYAQNVDEDNE